MLKEYYFVGGVFYGKQYYLYDVDMDLEKFAKGNNVIITFKWKHQYPTEWIDPDNNSYTFSDKIQAETTLDEVEHLHIDGDFELVPITIAHI
jgi:hypothetical protein